MAKMLDDNFIPTPGLVQMSEVIEEIYSSFGGPRTFARHVHEQMREVMNRRPATSASVAMLLRFMQLHWKVEESVKAQAVSDMTDDQLRREQDIGLMKMILDAATDPGRRELLDKFMSLQGMKLVGMTSTEILNDDDCGVETAEAARAGA